MWYYLQASGELLRTTAIVVGTGYAGHGEGKNNPGLQHVANVGPLPCGDYLIEEAHDSLMHGPLCFRLTPDPLNDMFGRDHMMIHGDSIEHPGEASQGCVVMARHIRDFINTSVDRRLRVLADREALGRDQEVQPI